MVFYWGEGFGKSFSDNVLGRAPHLGLHNYRACSQWVYSGGLPFTGRVAVIGAGACEILGIRYLGNMSLTDALNVVPVSC